MHRAVVALSSVLLLGLCVSGVGQASEAAPESGKAVFEANCAVCHRASGAGTPGLAPPLTQQPAAFAATAEGRRQLALTLLYGMYGDIVVGERHYNFKMPEFQKLDDATIASVINYVVGQLAGGSGLPPVTAAEIAAERVHPIDGAAVRAHRAIAESGQRP
jgi:mono/diheme cytochrome c family protein